ncbi:MAG: type II toxin-antitoxin system RelE/ParE family toxin, partial [Candidatus Electrothrix sp. AX5]|nr:type II toxin-antitoxin system RelE/ParE family toxin [Candidatus Electrothrix sp. AX5]
MYSVELMPKAVKDLKKLPKPDAAKIVAQIQSLENGLTGDTKNRT